MRERGRWWTKVDAGQGRPLEDGHWTSDQQHLHLEAHVFELAGGDGDAIEWIT